MREYAKKGIDYNENDMPPQFDSTLILTSSSFLYWHVLSPGLKEFMTKFLEKWAHNKKNP